MATTPPTPTAQEIALIEAAIRAGERLNAQQLLIVANEEHLLELINQRAAADEDWEQKEQIRRQKRIESLENETKYFRMNIDNVKELAKINEESSTSRAIWLSKELNLTNEKIIQNKSILENSLKNAKSDTERNEAIEKYIKDTKELIIIKKIQSAQFNEEEAYNRRGEEAAISFVNAFGIKTHKQQLSLTEGAVIGRLNYELMGKEYAEMAASGLMMQNTMAAFGQKVLESTIAMIRALDTLSADMYKLTGGSKELKSEFASLAEYAGASGVSVQTMGSSITGLTKNSSNFTEITKSQRAEVAKNNAQLIALGVSADTAGKNFSIFTQALGMTANQANASSRELVSLANNLHMSFEEISSGFGEAATTVAAYGQGAVREFSKLAAESKALGLSVQELINIVKGADTFQGAAEQAGKLNAMLGGGLLNSSQLLVASESERIQLIRDAVMQTGRSFSTMSKYEQIAIANAAGIQDLTVAQKLFNQEISGSELDRYLGKTNALGQTQEEMEAQALAAQSAQEKFSIVMEQFSAVALPLVEILGQMMSFLVGMGPLLKIIGTLFMFWTTVTNIHSFATKTLTSFQTAYRAAKLASIPVISAEVAATEAETIVQGEATIAKNAGWLATLTATMYNWLFKTSIDATNMSAGRMILILVLIVGAFYLLYEVLHKSGSPMLYAIFGFMAIGIFFFGEALNRNKQGILAFGAAMLMVGAGAFMAFHGLEGFATALSKLDPKQLAALVAVIIILALTMVVLFAIVISAGSAAVGPMLALGAAFLLIGAGAYLAGLGLSLVVDSIVGLIGAVASNMAVLFFLPLFLQIMAISLVAISIGLVIFTETLIGVGLAMMAFYVPILAAIGLITLLALAINSITPEKSIALKTTTDSIKNFVDTGKEITPEITTNLGEVVKQIHKLNVEATISKAVNVTAPFKELIDAVRGQTAATAANKETTVIMKLNDREFGKAVVGVMNEYGTNNTSIRKPTPA